MHRKVEGHCQGDDQAGNHDDDRPGCTDGADQPLLEQRADEAAALPSPGTGDGRGGRAVQAVECHQQTDEQKEHADEAFDIEGRKTIHVAGHQPGTQQQQSDRQDVNAPAEDLRQKVDPAAGQAAPVGREETEQRQQANNSHDHAEDVHFALGRDVTQERETFGRVFTTGGGALWLVGA